MNPLEQTFLNEPYKKWFVFFVVMSMFVMVWGGVVRLIARK